MPALSAETYLRRRAEEDLRDGAADESPGGLREQARALTAVGLLPAATAREVLAGLDRARAARGIAVEYHGDPGSDGGAARVCGIWGRLDVNGAAVSASVAAFSAAGVRIAARIHAPDGFTSRRSRHLAGPPQLTLRDDTGRSVSAGFSGGGSDTDYRGSYHADGLSRSTRWLEIGKTRFPLLEPTAAAVVTDLLGPDASVAERAERYVEHCLAWAAQAWDRSSVLAAVDAFVETGALAADADVVERARRAAAAPPGHHRAYRPHSADSEPDGIVAVHALAPPCDGVTIAVEDLERYDDEFVVGVVAVGPGAWHPRHPASIAPRFLVSARDDLGTEYRSAPRDSSTDGNFFIGRFSFTPALDPRAAGLDLVFSTETSRLTVPVRLDDGGAS